MAGYVDAPRSRTRPLTCFAIRVLSSVSWRLRDVDLHHLFVSDIRGAKSQEVGGRSKGMAIRGHVRGDPRSGEDERQRTFRRPPASGRRYMIRVLISASWRH